MALPTTLVRADYGSWTETISLPTWGSASARILYVFTRNGSKPVEKEASFDGTTATLELTAAESAELDSGEWRLVRVIEEDGKREASTAVPRVIVQPDPLEAEELSFNSRMVAALKASIEGRVDDESGRMLESHTINGQSISKMPLEQQQRLLERYEARLRAERDRERIATGGVGRRTIYPDFT